ncbi:MAG TPA: hypothetical protein VIK20_06620 [Bacteroidales bacterium]
MNASIENYGGFLPKISNSVTGLLAMLVIVLVIVVVVAIIYRIYMIRQINKKEYWLPVVDEGGHVIGRVARSVSLEKPGTYNHPLIRILTFKSGNIYLSPRTYEFCPDFGKYDHPFECMMEYGFSVEETLEKMQKKFFPNSPPPKFLLRYKHENKIGNWQVLLYVLTIQDENELIGLDKSNGKFWTLSQIRENLGKSYFSAFLEGEIDFLESLLNN